MRLLLDTQIALWAFTDSPNLSQKARSLIENRRNRPTCSVVSAWEVQIKHFAHSEALFVNGPQFLEYCETSGFEVMPLSQQHILELPEIKATSRKLGTPHKDPYDQMLMAQAQAEGLLLLTHDEKIIRYDEDFVVAV